jgi:hypothetical protein
MLNSRYGQQRATPRLRCAVAFGSMKMRASTRRLPATGVAKAGVAAVTSFGSQIKMRDGCVRMS